MEKKQEGEKMVKERKGAGESRVDQFDRSAREAQSIFTSKLA
jgi:hypothetical protein